ncbi:MAG TPA: hypothetical protein VHL08_07330 [Dongiaceae bacterium]|nr:hypothetical protein [Dongiaceae bacterium]
MMLTVFRGETVKGSGLFNASEGASFSSERITAPIMSDVSLPELLSEREAAGRIRIKYCALRAERIKGNIGYIRIGARIYYLAEQLAEYLTRQSIKPCEKRNEQDRSEVTGSAKSHGKTGPTMSGAGRGTIPRLDKHVVSVLARQTFKKPV